MSQNNLDQFHWIPGPFARELFAARERALRAGRSASCVLHFDHNLRFCLAALRNVTRGDSTAHTQRFLAANSKHLWAHKETGSVVRYEYADAAGAAPLWELWASRAAQVKATCAKRCLHDKVVYMKGTQEEDEVSLRPSAVECERRCAGYAEVLAREGPGDARAQCAFPAKGHLSIFTPWPTVEKFFTEAHLNCTTCVPK